MEEYDEVELIPEKLVRFPTTVTVAFIIWLLLGGLVIQMVHLQFLSRLLPLPAQAPQGGQDASSMILAELILGLVGLAFLSAGFKGVTGKIADVRGNSHASIILSVLGCIVATMNATSNRTKLAVLIALFYGVAGVALITAGALARAGRAQYQLWRQELQARGGPYR